MSADLLFVAPGEPTNPRTAGRDVGGQCGGSAPKLRECPGCGLPIRAAVDKPIPAHNIHRTKTGDTGKQCPAVDKPMPRGQPQATDSPWAHRQSADTNTATKEQ